MKRVLFVVLMVVISTSLFAQAQPKQPTKAQQELISQAKPLQDKLAQLKSVGYDYKKALEETEKQIIAIESQLQELQKKFEALPKEEEKTPTK